MAPLSLQELQKAQAEAEGFQNGPQPALNPANLYTQAVAGNPQPTPPAPTPVPYYPSSETPNLQLSTRDLSAEVANNFVKLDTLLSTNVPIIQARLDGVGITVVKTISITASPSINQLYAISLFEQSTGIGAAGHTLVTTITYTSPAVAGAQIVTITMPLDSANTVMETYPFYVVAGASLTLTTAYGGGATNDPYTITARLVQMP